MSARLAYLSIYVRGLTDSRAFYAELLGLPIVSDEEWGCILDAGGVQLFLHPRDAESGQRLELTFDVDDADAEVMDLRSRGVRIVEDVADREWGDRDGAVLDPDGNVVYLRSKRTRE